MTHPLMTRTLKLEPFHDTPSHDAHSYVEPFHDTPSHAESVAELGRGLDEFETCIWMTVSFFIHSRYIAAKLRNPCMRHMILGYSVTQNAQMLVGLEICDARA